MNFIKNLYTAIIELFKVQKKVDQTSIVDLPKGTQVQITVPTKPKRKYVRKNKNVTN